jgi:hypothetical protein
MSFSSVVVAPHPQQVLNILLWQVVVVVVTYEAVVAVLGDTGPVHFLYLRELTQLLLGVVVLLEPLA